MTDDNALADWEQLIRDEAECIAERENACSGCCGPYGTDTWKDYEADVRAEFEKIGAAYLALRTPDEHPSAEDYRNRAERAEQALAERDAEVVRLRELVDQAAQIIGQIELDHRYPPAPDSMERRLERARYWLVTLKRLKAERAALEGIDAVNKGAEQ